MGQDEAGHVLGVDHTTLRVAGAGRGQGEARDPAPAIHDLGGAVKGEVAIVGEQALADRSSVALRGLFADECHWRDLLAFTWNISPHEGPASIVDRLIATEKDVQARTFRIAHDHEEGDRSVTRLAAGAGLHFLTGRGSCVKDAYISGTAVHYIEIACLVSGPKANSVIVGAAPPSSWSRTSGTIERAISAFRT